MRKVIYIVFFIIGVNLFASQSGDELFWNEVKNSNDIKMLQLYIKQYPNGIFAPLAKLKIKKLTKNSVGQIEYLKEKPSWIYGDTNKYKYYGFARVLKTFKGEDYQKKVAIQRADDELMDKFEEAHLTHEQIKKYKKLCFLAPMD